MEDQQIHFNKKKFMEFILNDADFYKEMIETTKETLITGKADMLAFFQSKDIEKIRQVAHLLKGHSLTMYFDELHKISLTLEHSAINKDFDSISKNIPCFEKEIDCLLENHLNETV